MCVLATIEEDVPEAKGSSEGICSFLDTLVHVGTLVCQTWTKFFRHQQASRKFALGANVVSAIRNNAALGQSLFMAANPPLPNAASFIHNQITRISSQQGRNTVVTHAGDAEVDLRTFGCPNQAGLWGQLTGTGLVGESIGANASTAPLTAGRDLLPDHNHQQWICNVEENYGGNYEEIIRVSTTQSLGSIATTEGKVNFTNTNMMTSAPSAVVANYLIPSMRKRAAHNEFDWSGDVSPGSKKQAGKVSVGLKSSNSDSDSDY